MVYLVQEDRVAKAFLLRAGQQRELTAEQALGEATSLHQDPVVLNTVRLQVSLAAVFFNTSHVPCRSFKTGMPGRLSSLVVCSRLHSKCSL